MYSRRGLRLRRRGAYGIHRASSPRCQGLCRKVASLRSGGRRLAVRKTIEYQIGALPRTPFPAAREFPSRGNERYEEKNRGVICFMYYSSISPFGGWRHYLSAPLGSVSLNSQSPTVPCESSSLATSSKGHYKPVLTIESHMGRLPRGALLSHRAAGGRWCRKAPKGGKPPEVANHRNAYQAI